MKSLGLNSLRLIGLTLLTTLAISCSEMSDKELVQTNTQGQELLRQEENARNGLSTVSCNFKNSKGEFLYNVVCPAVEQSDENRLNELKITQNSLTNYLKLTFELLESPHISNRDKVPIAARANAASEYLIELDAFITTLEQYESSIESEK